MQSRATSIPQYLKELPDDRRTAIEAVRKVILANLDGDIEEGMQYGMIGYFVPYRVFPQGYHCKPKQPLPYACLASQKNYMSLYLMSVYGEGTEGENWFRREWAKSGKKLDMGKSCVRFKTVDDLALDVIGAAFRRVGAKEYVAYYTSIIDPETGRPRSTRPSTAKSAKKKAPAKKAAAKKK